MLVGNEIPLPDESVDMAMCQTLLMHLKKPEKALQEMKRILKPGGIIMCKEPDNLGVSLGDGYSSETERTIEEQVLEFIISLYTRIYHEIMIC